MKIEISFCSKKISDLYLMKIQTSFLICRNFSDLYLMKIQTSFVVVVVIFFNFFFFTSLL